jgi:hypothetical protein
VLNVEQELPACTDDSSRVDCKATRSTAAATSAKGKRRGTTVAGAVNINDASGSREPASPASFSSSRDLHHHHCRSVDTNSASGVRAAGGDHSQINDEHGTLLSQLSAQEEKVLEQVLSKAIVALDHTKQEQIDMSSLDIEADIENELNEYNNDEAQDNANVNTQANANHGVIGAEEEPVGHTRNGCRSQG